MYQPFNSIRALAHAHVLRGGSIMPVVHSTECGCGRYLQIVAPSVPASHFTARLVEGQVVVLVGHAEENETLPLLIYQLRAYPFTVAEHIDLMLRDGELNLFIPSGQKCSKTAKRHDCVDFPESNLTLIGGEGVYDLKAYRQTDPETGQPLLLTKFQLDTDDLQALIENGGAIWLGFQSSTIPPVFLMTNSPFKQADNEDSAK